MNKVLIAILLMSSVCAYSQCEGDIKSLGVSTNFKGITLEVSHIAQETRVGFILGSSLYMKKEPEYSYIYDVEKSEYVSVRSENSSLKGAIHAYGTYKLIHKEYSYSLHVLGGGVYDEDDGIYLSGGIEGRMPLGNKCLFIRGLYPYDFRVGVLFQL